MKILKRAALAFVILLTGASQVAVAKNGDSASENSRRIIRDQYIVVLDRPQRASAQARMSINQRTNYLLGHVGGGRVMKHYKRALNGFAVKMSARAAERMSKLKGVKYVEPVMELSASAIQSDPTWGLDRIDQHLLPLDASYTYPDNGGEGVHLYILDSGLNLEHEEFTGRIGAGANFAKYDHEFWCRVFGWGCDEDYVEDCNGHGTHVAGTAAGSTYGVAKNAWVHPVRVLSCEGKTYTWRVINGLEWLLENAELPAVANMSLGGGGSSSLDEAIQAAIDAGITIVAAAGNETADACGRSPARIPNVITVGASTDADARASFSNFGSCVDLFAPGDAITSAWVGSPTAAATARGTSMAAPHVAGAAALKLAEDPTLSPLELTFELLSDVSLGVLSDVQGSPNALLFTGP